LGTPHVNVARSCFLVRASNRIDTKAQSRPSAVAMTPQRRHESTRWSRWVGDRLQEGIAVRSPQNHALMLFQNPTRALVRKIAGGEP
jgi:hypothetical protein